jgi:hypothetical protein
VQPRGEGAERIRFSSAILPPYALKEPRGALYLKGVSTGDFEEAMIDARGHLV